MPASIYTQAAYLASAGGPPNSISAFDYDGSNNLIYQGWAAPGTALSDAAWAIQKNTFTAGNLTLTQLAGGDNLPNKVWNDRVSLAYS